jgi:hypothetical protein
VRVVGAAAAEAVESRELRSAEEVRAAARDLCCAAARNVVDAYGGDVRAKSLLGAGPLMTLDDNELDHWLRMLRVRVAATAQSTLWRLVAEAEIGVRGGRTGQVRCDAELAVADVRDVAPPEDEASVRGRVERAVRALAATGDNDAARALLRAVIADERDALMRTAGMERAHAAFYGALLTLAYFLDCVGAGSEAHASCVAFAADILQGVLRADGSSTWNSFFLDGERLFFSDAVFDAARDLLGQAHPLIQSLDALVVAPRAAAAEEEEWPDESSIRSARIADAQQAAPVPERVWAMRNAAGRLPNFSSKPPPGLSLTQACARVCVPGTLAMTGARGQAVALLSKAVALKAEWLGSDTHAGLLGELCDLHAVLDDADEAADVAGASWDSMHRALRLPHAASPGRSPHPWHLRDGRGGARGSRPRARCDRGA